MTQEVEIKLISVSWDLLYRKEMGNMRIFQSLTILFAILYLYIVYIYICIYTVGPTKMESEVIMLFWILFQPKKKKAPIFLEQDI